MDDDLSPIDFEQIFLGELIQQTIGGFPGRANGIGKFLVRHGQVDNDFLTGKLTVLLCQHQQEGQHAVPDILAGEHLQFILQFADFIAEDPHNFDRNGWRI